MTNDSDRTRWPLPKPGSGPILLLILALAAVGLALYQTRFGPGASGDSTSYLMGAHNLMAGNGYSRYSGGYELKPITGFPPLYSIVLSLPIGLGVDPYQAGRWINAILFGLNLLVVGLIVRRLSSSWVAAILSAGLVATQPEQFLWHTWVMSEPLFTCLMLLSLGAILRLQRADRTLGWWTVLAGILVASATLTRLVGASLLLAGGLWLLLASKGAWRRRLLRGAAFALIAGLPVLAWLVYAAGDTTGIANRQLTFHGIDQDLVRLFSAELSSWFVPHEVPLPTMVRAGLAILLAVGATLWLVWRRMAPEAVEQRTASSPSVIRRLGVSDPSWLLLLTIAAYGLVLAVNSLFLDASTSPSAVPRYLAPLFVIVVIFFASSIPPAIRQAGSIKWPVYAVLAYAVALMAIYGWQSARLLSDPVSAIGYTGYRYTWPEFTAALQTIDQQRPILSNNPELVYVLAGRPAYVRPIRFDQYQQAFREDYEEQMAFAENLLTEGALLIVFHPVEEADQAVIERAGLQPVEVFPDATILASAPGETDWNRVARAWGASGVR